MIGRRHQTAARRPLAADVGSANRFGDTATRCGNSADRDRDISRYVSVLLFFKIVFGLSEMDGWSNRFFCIYHLISCYLVLPSFETWWDFQRHKVHSFGKRIDTIAKGMFFFSEVAPIAPYSLGFCPRANRAATSPSFRIILKEMIESRNVHLRFRIMWDWLRDAIHPDEFSMKESSFTNNGNIIMT